jgi:hypothetical protein
MEKRKHLRRKMLRYLVGIRFKQLANSRAYAPPE